jgi:hypothetical protein
MFGVYAIFTLGLPANSLCSCIDCVQNDAQTRIDPALGAENEEEEEVYSHRTAGKCTITIR